MKLSIDDVLPALAAEYDADRLVPFIGSGMSAGACVTWSPLIQRVCEAVGIEASDHVFRSDAPSGDLIRQADEAMRVLQALPFEVRARKIRWAVTDGAPTATDDASTATEKASTVSIPKQTLELATARWPLVISTNYDDLYWSAAAAVAAKGKQLRRALIPRVVGRSPSDCHRVVRSLHSPSDPLLWAVQGFVGGLINPLEEILPEESARRRLVSEVVLSHKQYQDAINGAAHFRRSFAEVFQSKTLLFLGSGILEDYLINLFAEVVTYHGNAMRPHYAFFCGRAPSQLSQRFLRDRLGILCVTFDSHKELPGILKRLIRATRVPTTVQETAKRTQVCVARQDAIEFTICAEAQIDSKASATSPCMTVRLARTTLDPKNVRADTAVGLSVGRSGGRIVVSKYGMQVLTEVGLQNSPFPIVENHLYIHRPSDGRGFYAVAARAPDAVQDKDSEIAVHDFRELALVSRATLELLSVAQSDGYESVRVGLIAAGPGAPWHPVYSLIQMLAGVRAFAVAQESNAGLSRIEIPIVDSAVWGAVVSDQIPVRELLTSPLSTTELRIEGEDGHDVCLAIGKDLSVADALAEASLKPSDWQWELVPAHANTGLSSDDARKCVPFSTLRVRRRA